jgi:DNA-binding NtrC family response regulator/tetratricopeptide (TPR) repeat protein
MGSEAMDRIQRKRAPADMGEGPWHEALRIVLQRGLDLRDRGSLPEAGECFRHCLDLSDRLQLPEQIAVAHGCLGSVAILHGDYRGARSSFEQALAIRAKAGDAIGQARSLNDIAICDLRLGHSDQAFQGLCRSLALTATDTDGRIRAETLESMGRVHLDRGELKEALRFFSDCFAIHQGMGDQVRMAAAFDAIGKVHHRLSMPEEAFAAFRQAYEIRRSLPDRRATAATANNLATVHYSQGQLEEAESLLGEALSGFLAVGHLTGVAAAHSNLGLICADQGRMEQAEEHHRQALKIREDLQDLSGQANSWNNLSHVAIERGDAQEGLRRAEKAIELRRATGVEAVLVKPLYNQARAIQLLGRIDEARGIVGEVLRLAKVSGAAESLAEGHHLAAEIALAASDTKGAAQHAEAALTAGEGAGDPRLIASALRILASERSARGETKEARELLARAERCLKGRMYGAELPRVHRDQGVLAWSVGAQETAVERLSRAVRELAQVGNRREEAPALALLARSEALLGLPDAGRTRARAEEMAAHLREAGIPVELIATAGSPEPAPQPGEADARGLGAAVGILESLRGMDSIAEIGPCLASLRVAAGVECVGLVAGPIGRPGRRTTAVPLEHGRVLWVSSDRDPERQKERLESPSVREEIPGTMGTCALVASGQPGATGRSIIRVLALHLGATRLGGLSAQQELLPSAGDRGWEGLVGISPIMQSLYMMIERVARSEVSVLILGESGTGKELVARAIHARSARSRGPFSAINCPSIPRELIEAELFGHEKGAYTGATTARPGKVELADTGILFLDEVADMDLAVQSKLLRFLQEREFQRVGGRQAIRVDVRVLAATSRGLDAAMEQGAFRPDLYFRLNVVQIAIPPLRERRGDIPVLVHSFLSEIGSRSNRKIAITGQALERLAAHSWPGNVRELKNTVAHMVAMADEDTIDCQHLPASLPRSMADPRAQLGDTIDPGGSALNPGETVADRLLAVEARLYRWALAEEKWNQSATARRLGVTETMVRNRMRSLGIRKPEEESEGRHSRGGERK